MSSRTVWPYLFTLHVMSLKNALRNTEAAAILERFFPKVSANAIPVALRWVTTPELGFPREPFHVYRRAPAALDMAGMNQDGMVPISNTRITVAGTSIIPVAQTDLQYFVVALVAVSAGASLTIEALDALQRPIPGQSITTTTNNLVKFRTPGIAALRVTGNGWVDQIWGIGETVYANLSDWQLIEVVGLPFLKNEIGAAYNTLPQGFVTPTLDGPTAAIIRLTIAGLLQSNPPSTGIADFPLPPWPIPNPTAYVQNIRSKPPAAMGMATMAGRCLQWASDTNPTKMQVQYLEPVTMSGIKQADVANAPAGPNTNVQLPVVGVAMLGVSTDSYAAVALGYGTVDLPPTKPAPANPSTPATTAALDRLAAAPSALTAPLPPATASAASAAVAFSPATAGVAATPTPAVIDPNSPLLIPPTAVGYDYMVTAPFTLPSPLNATLTLAALSSIHPPVEAPVGLSTSIKQINVPLKRNQAAPAAIKVSWQPSSIPQGYGILASRVPNSAVILNAPRVAGIGGYDSYVAVEPLNPDPNTPPGLQLPNFVDTGAAVPLRPPPAATRYLVAGLDVFGLWSGWQQASATLAPAEILKPHIRNAEFIMNAGAATGHVVPATLRIDFVWDWQDRAPGQIRLTGNFVPTNAMLASPLPPGAPTNVVPTPPFLTGFAKSVSGPVGTPIMLTFNYPNQTVADTAAPNAILPVIDSAHASAATISILPPQSSNVTPPPPPPPSPGSVVHYRLELTGMALNFTSVNDIAFAVYATGTEQIRPGEWSDANDAGIQGTGRIARAADPLPPTVTFAPPAISWTALPDAEGIARGILQWTADPKAAGYYVWEATESALWALLAPNTLPPPLLTSMVTRAANLSALIAANQDASLQAFARLNKDPIVGNRTEVLLPASASTLYVYRISAISAVNVEAPRSTQIAYFAVPRRNTPGIPRLMVRDATAATPHIRVIVTPVESGATAAGYRVFRVRSAALSLDGHTMGPPRIGENDSGWGNYSDMPRNATSLRVLSQGATTGRTILDATAGPSWYPYYYRATAIGISDTVDVRYSGESDFSQVQSAYSLPANPPQVTLASSQNFPFAKQLGFTMNLPLTPSPVGPARVELLRTGPDPSNPGRIIAYPIVSLAPSAITVGMFGVPPPVLQPPALLRSQAPGETWTLYARIPSTPAGAFALRFTDPLGRQSLHQV